MHDPWPASDKPTPVDDTIFERIMDTRAACAHLGDCRQRAADNPASYEAKVAVQEAEASLLHAAQHARQDLRIVGSD